MVMLQFPKVGMFQLKGKVPSSISFADSNKRNSAMFSQNNLKTSSPFCCAESVGHPIHGFFRTPVLTLRSRHRSTPTFSQPRLDFASPPYNTPRQVCAPPVSSACNRGGSLVDGWMEMPAPVCLLMRKSVVLLKLLRSTENC